MSVDIATNLCKGKLRRRRPPEALLKILPLWKITKKHFFKNN